MTKRLHVYCTIVMGAASVMTATSAAADEEEKSPVEAVLKVIDKNGDGELDRSEIDAATASLRKLDTNDDGRISKAELRRDREGGRRQMDFSRIDTNGDGKISKAEAPERMRERFDRMDRNGDGVIDQEEQEAIKRFIKARMGDGEKRQRRGDRDDGQGGTVKPKRPASAKS